MMKNTSKLSEKNPAWYDARIKVLDRFFDNIIDFETFKKEIAGVDDKYKHPEKLTELEILQMKEMFEKKRSYLDSIKLDELNFDPERAKYVRLKRQMDSHAFGSRSELDAEEYERLRKKFES